MSRMRGLRRTVLHRLLVVIGLLALFNEDPPITRRDKSKWSRFQCPRQECMRVKWHTIDRLFCFGGRGDGDRHVMTRMHPTDYAEAPGDDSSDIVFS